MHWLIQHMKKEASFDSLVELLNRLNLNYSFVQGSVKHNKIVLQSDLLAGMSVEDAPAWEAPADKVCTLGSYGLAKVAKSLGLTPGAFLNDNFEMSRWIEGWGADNLLNGHSWVGPLSEAQSLANSKMFIRPCEDTKSFSGEVVESANFSTRKAQLLATLPGSTSIVVAPLKEIYVETRLFVVGGRIVTYSTYKRGSKVVYDTFVHSDVLQWAQDRINEWQPDRAFVLDVAQTSEGFKIVEVNNLNSSGFYACDISKIVEAIEDLYSA